MPSADAKPPLILCGGIIVQDLIMRVMAFPAAGTKVRSDEFLIVGGGCAANAAVAVARLGGRARLAGPLGGPAEGDLVGDALIAGLEREGVDVSGVVRLDGATSPVSLILIDDAGEKIIVTHSDDRLTSLHPDNADALVRDAGAVVVDNRFPDFVLPLLHAARRRRIPAVIDIDRVTGMDDPLFLIASHLLFSAEALRATTSHDDLGVGLRQIPSHAFLAATDGERGAVWLDGTTPRRMSAFKVEVRDTVGAGDVFHGAFALAIAEGSHETDAMRFASAAAALKCTRFGGISGTPMRAQVAAMLLSQQDLL